MHELEKKQQQQTNKQNVEYCFFFRFWRLPEKLISREKTSLSQSQKLVPAELKNLPNRKIKLL